MHRMLNSLRLRGFGAEFPYLRQFLALPPDTDVIMAPPTSPSTTVTGKVVLSREATQNPDFSCWTVPEPDSRTAGLRTVL